jgi:pimeloyl-ACP methyl ester carboxylesterase
MGRSSEYANDFSKQTPEGNFFEKPLPRRRFLRLGGEVVALAVAGDTIAGEIMWGGTNPEIHKIDNPEAAHLFPDTYTLAIGGFNVANVEGLGKTVETILPGYGQTAYLQNSSNGIDMRDIEREALRFIKENNVNRLRIYGHSMGGMVAIELAAYLKDRVGLLEAIILDCTPASHLDLRGNKQAGTLLLHVADELSLHLGPAARVVMETASPILDGRDDIVTICLNSMNKVLSPDKICPNGLLESQGSFMRTFNIADHYDVFSESTHIIELRPADFDRDETVDNKSSHARLESGLGRKVMDVPVVGSGHADPGGHQQAYRAALCHAAEQCGFYRGQAGHSRVRAV